MIPYKSTISYQAFNQIMIFVSALRSVKELVQDDRIH